MIQQDFKNILQLHDAYPTEQSCIEQLESIRWDGNVVSPYDITSFVYKCKDNKYICKNTGKTFNVRTGTMYESSRIPLRKWFVAVWLVTCEKKGVPSTELARMVGITQKSAWFMLHRIRKQFGISNDEPPLTGEVEMDESFFGGKNKNRHWNKKVKNSQGRSFKDKTPVLGMVERGGSLIANVIPDTSQKSITPIVLQRVDTSATIYTDEWMGYDKVGALYHREFVDHGKGQYSTGNITTNRIENFWSIIKRGIIGVYQMASRKHLQKYVDEFVWRYNVRKLKHYEAFGIALCNMQHRLTYKQLIYG